MREIRRLIRSLPDTVRIQRGAKMGILQKQGPPIVGIVKEVSHRRGTVTLETRDTDGQPTGTVTAPAKRATYFPEHRRVL